MNEVDIFMAALQRENPRERADYLALACSGDDSLRRRLEELLQAHEKAVRNPAGEEPVPTTVSRPPGEGPGSRIGPYKLLQEIGEGGMGVVYMAEQEHPVRRRVALKIIKPGMDSGQVIARFEAERQALAMMDHLNIARVLDAGTTEGGRPYFVMELVHGVPITRYCDENRLTPRERLELFVPVCQALQHAHQKGIIHRDIKPSNVLVTMYDGKPVAKVIDFGVAKATEQRLTERTMFTNYGTIVGTLEYMPPEQAEMSALGVDTRGDIYSLGVLLYELLTGTTPFERKRLQEAALSEMLRLIKEEEPPRPSLRLSSSGAALASISQKRGTEPGRLTRLVRGELDWIVMKCLEKDRTRRYETANGLARDLQRHLADEPVEACPPSVGYRLRKLARRHRKLLAAAAAFVLVLVAGVVVSSVLAVQARRDREAAASAETRARTERDLAREANRNLGAAQEKLQHTLYGARMNLIQAAWESNNVGRVVELLEQQIPAGGPDLRGFEWYYWRRLCNADLRTIKLPTEDLRIRGILSNDGRTVAGAVSLPFHREWWEIRLWDTGRGEEKRRLPAPLPAAPGEEYFRVVVEAISPDGDRLAVAMHHQSSPVGGLAKSNLVVFDLRMGKEIFTVAPAPGFIRGAAFSRDGRRVAWTCVNRESSPVESTLNVREASTGQDLLSVSTAGSMDAPTFSPDGTQIAAGVIAQEPGVRVWDAATGAQVLSLPAPAGYQQLVVRYSPDGALIADASGLGDEPAKVRVRETRHGKEVLTLSAQCDFLTDLQFSPDGKYLAVSGADPALKVWEVATGELKLTLKGHTRDILSIAYSPDGRQLTSLAEDGTVKFWDATVRTREKGESGPRGQVRAGLSPDGSRVAVSMAREDAPGQLAIRDAAGKDLFTFEMPKGSSKGMAFSADSGRLFAAWQAAGPDGDAELKVWDAVSGRALLNMPLGAGVIRTLIIVSSDGTRIAALVSPRSTDGTLPALGRTSGEITVWHAPSGKKVLAIPNPPDRYWVFLAWSPDGRRLAASFRPDGAERPRGIQVWDAASGAEVITLEGNRRELQRLAFSPDGSLLAAAVGIASQPGEVCLWDLSSGRKRYTLGGHSGLVTGLAFSPDGRRIASISSFGTANVTEVKVWDAATGQELLHLKRLRPPGQANAISFGANGRRLIASFITTSREDVLQSWDATPLPGDLPAKDARR